jgi:hypothetical protein
MLDSDLIAFFSDRQRLRQIDHLHRLLFQCLQSAEADVVEEIKIAMDGIAADRAGKWKRQDVPAIGRNGKLMQYAHVGIVPATNGGKWPSDLCVHIGWNLPNLFASHPWIGIYTREADKKLYEELQTRLKPLLTEHPALNSFDSNDPYPIYDEMPDSPMGWSRNRLNEDASLVGLAGVLTHGDGGIVSLATMRVTGILDELDR